MKELSLLFSSLDAYAKISKEECHFLREHVKK
jgi:hypothetical protein